MNRHLSKNPLLLGLVVGLVFGSVDVLLTWLDPVEDDSPGVLIRFYGPMFLVWIAVSFRVARGTGRLSSGVAAGIAVAFGTFCTSKAHLSRLGLRLRSAQSWALSAGRLASTSWSAIRCAPLKPGQGIEWNEKAIAGFAY